MMALTTVRIWDLFGLTRNLDDSSQVFGARLNGVSSMLQPACVISTVTSTPVRNMQRGPRTLFQNSKLVSGIAIRAYRERPQNRKFKDHVPSSMFVCWLCQMHLEDPHFLTCILFASWATFSLVPLDPVPPARSFSTRSKFRVHRASEPSWFCGAAILTWPPKVCNIMTFWALSRCIGLLLYIA